MSAKGKSEMSDVYIGLIGALTGFLMGQFVTGSRQAIVIDVIAGAIAAWVTVVLCRAVLPVAAGQPLMSAIVAAIGAIIILLVMNRFLRSKLLSSRR
jgi:uncharacterized membrane protein YeaQ/YmgE (transglycosylase-associated protein family)